MIIALPRRHYRQRERWNTQMNEMMGLPARGVTGLAADRIVGQSAQILLDTALMKTPGLTAKQLLRRLPRRYRQAGQTLLAEGLGHSYVEDVNNRCFVIPRPALLRHGVSIASGQVRVVH